MSDNPFSAFAAILALGASLWLGWFHISRAFRERGARETRDIALGCIMAMSGLVAPMATGVIPNPLPRALLFVLIIATIILMSWAAKATEGESGDTEADHQPTGEEIFAPRRHWGYISAAMVVCLGTVMIFLD